MGVEFLRESINTESVYDDCEEEDLDEKVTKGMMNEM